MKTFAEALKIQTDNLCQFLPQDKVHDFSRLNSKGLLDSTVEAVGDTDLQKNHHELKELQRALSEGEDLFERKRQILEEKSAQCRRLEEEVEFKCNLLVLILYVVFMIR